MPEIRYLSSSYVLYGSCNFSSAWVKSLFKVIPNRALDYPIWHLATSLNTYGSSRSECPTVLKCGMSSLDLWIKTYRLSCYTELLWKTAKRSKTRILILFLWTQKSWPIEVSYLKMQVCSLFQRLFAFNFWFLEMGTWLLNLTLGYLPK